MVFWSPDKLGEVLQDLLLNWDEENFFLLRAHLDAFDEVRQKNLSYNFRDTKACSPAGTDTIPIASLSSMTKDSKTNIFLGDGEDKARLPAPVAHACSNFSEYLDVICSHGPSLDESKYSMLAVKDMLLGKGINNALWGDSGPLKRSRTQIDLPPKFARQMSRTRAMAIFWLAGGAFLISNMIAVFPLLWVTTWDANVSEVGVILALGEGTALVLLLLASCQKTVLEEVETNADAGGPNENHVSSLLKRVRVLVKTLLRVFEQPNMVLLGTVLALVSTGILGFRVPMEEEDHGSMYATHVTAALMACVANSILHSSGCELMVLYVADDEFQSTLAKGYALKRVMNLGTSGMSMTLSGLVSIQAPFVAVFLFYLCIFLPSQLWAFGVDLQIIKTPAQRTAQDQRVADSIAAFRGRQLQILKERVRKKLVIAGLMKRSTNHLLNRKNQWSRLVRECKKNATKQCEAEAKELRAQQYAKARNAAIRRLPY